MSWLSDLLRVPSSSNPDKPEIKDEQYLDKNGRTFLNAYISFYERDLSADSLSNESSSFYMSSFYTVPTPKNEKHWELAHSLETYKGGLKTFVVDDGVKRIGKRAFAYNLNLYKIDLPDGLEELDQEVFLSCYNLRNITIPNTVSFIGKNAFDNALKELRILSPNPPSITTLGISPDCIVYIPIDFEKEYQASRLWRRYLKQTSFI